MPREVHAMSAGAAGVAAAAAVQRQREQEEEQMTGYTPQELAEGWEFKIVRSSTNGFKRDEFLRQVLDEEGRAGWMLLEKFDNGRIRLKRPASARAGDSALGQDPYRSHVGISDLALVLTIMGSIFGVLGLVAAIVAALH
jgi:hypothetical protein